ncbi:uncharacterized protein LY79DRAFT_270331 [Colletotrichum navitas]|uniref:Uncharacterized protein n=1 Tax=Colletotrichum navitas TaxID=681940 RepID=A0AAD8PWX7_9PEZI|nr:uncharacterized protein LY79DRAFT_270331 [Colletotrichum navitas]KAK1585318.1 hypothetical protein LY79DRAFT_270331 [Colletotrichum navitas]
MGIGEGMGGRGVWEIPPWRCFTVLQHHGSWFPTTHWLVEHRLSIQQHHQHHRHLPSPYHHATHTYSHLSLSPSLPLTPSACGEEKGRESQHTLCFKILIRSRNSSRPRIEVWPALPSFHVAERSMEGEGEREREEKKKEGWAVGPPPVC